MNSEKVKEIKKALECCLKPIDCNNCPYDGKCKRDELEKDILTLINELESENERLTKQYVDWKDLYYENTKRVKKLKDRIAELEKEKVCSHCQRIILGKDVYCLECLNRFREIALKSFVEMLKEKFNDTEYRAKTKRKTISAEELKAQNGLDIARSCC